MAEPKIYQKSPIVKEEKAGIYYWCACGQSANQPFCDGSHKGSSFSPLKVVVSEDKKIAWCACKNTNTAAFCDGTHKSL